MRRTDRYRLERIVEVGDQLSEAISRYDITEEDVLNDYGAQWILTTALIRIGEQAYALSKEYKAAHPEVPWSCVSGLRHRLVHDYEGVNWRYVVDSAFVDVPELVVRARSLLEEYDDSE